MYIYVYIGAQSIFTAGFDLLRYLDIIQTYKVNKCSVVPPMCIALAKHPIIDKYGMSQ